MDSNEFVLAALNGHVDAVITMLRKGVDVDTKALDGDTALHKASRRGHDKVVELLIKNGADLNVTNKDGDTALHTACRQGYNSVVELLVKNQADLLVANESHERPVDLAGGLARGTRLSLETGMLKQAEYIELVSTVRPEDKTTVRLFFLGDFRVGKTSLRKILEMTGFFVGTSWNIRRKLKRQDDFIPFPGVHVSIKTVRGIGRLCLYHFVGYAQFYVTHAMLLGTTNAIFPVVYKITDVEEEQKREVHSWLSFICCSNADPTNKPRVILIASHADKLQDKNAGWRRAKAIVEYYSKLYQESLVVSQEVFLINCLEAGSSGIQRLREVISAIRHEMLQQRPKVPKVYVKLSEIIEGWRKERKTFPVMEWQDYLTAVRQATHIYLEERIVQLASTYLHDEGEIIYPLDKTASLVVLDPQWLFTWVFGILLAPTMFPIVSLNPAARDCVTLDKITRAFGHVADISLLIKLLQVFQLCYTFDGHTFILPSQQQKMDEGEWSPVSSKAVYFGLQIRCRREIDSFSCDLFPRLQTLLMHANPHTLTKPLLWKNSAKCIYVKADALLQISQDKRRLNILVRSAGGNREDWNSIMDLLTDMTYYLLHEISPELRTQEMVLSALDLREHNPQPHAYSRKEVEKEAANGEYVVHPQRKVPEKVTDIMLHVKTQQSKLTYIVSYFYCNRKVAMA
ncbi:PREDICTED: death-associated protein kinase dapk-1-like [Branchiostoma belcheri]|uniref:Death-associated protein kinase dapk-1-like n=1 Tax=Branchiostoma belcheri TaxID=7741 RepID=A0A6P4Y5N7_BRABE|nr:PREDICTED: death-associated protein kinase dapk-1-like [Branchiostoma belcheri]